MNGALRAIVAALLFVSMGCTYEWSAGTKEAQKFHERGLQAFDADKHDEAIKQYELALKLDPLFTKCKSDLGRACHKRGFSDRGIAEIEDSIKHNPDLADSYCYLGEIYYDRKLYDRSEEEFKKAIETFANYDEAWFGLGRLYQTQKKEDKALEAYSTAAQNNPKFVEAHIAAGLLYLKNGVLKDAEQHFLLALEHDKNNPFGHYGLGEIAERNEQWEDAIRRYQQALEPPNPKNPTVISARKRCIQKAPSRVARIFVTSAKKNLDEGKVEDAMEDLEAAQLIDPKLIDVPILRAQAYGDMRPAKLAEAEKAIKQALAIDPKNKDARFNAARVTLLQWLAKPDDAKAAAAGKTKIREAEEILRALRREEPRSGKFHNLLGVCYFKQRLYRKAEREFQETLLCEIDDGLRKQVQDNIALVLKSPQIQKANQLNDQGVTALKARDLAEAFNCFQGATVLDDQFAVAYSNLALVLIEQGDLKTARPHAETAVKLDPDLGRAHNNLGVINMREGKLDAARKNFAEASVHDQRDPEPQYNLGIVALEQKKDADGKAAFEMAIGINPDHARSHHQLALLNLKQGAVGEAEKRLKVAIRADPKYLQARVDLARIYMRQKKHDLAQKELEEAYQLDNAAPEPWVGFAEVKEALGQKAEASDAYLESASRLGGLGRFDEAIRACREAVRLAPGSAKARSLLGVVLCQKGGYTEAIAELNRAVELDKETPLLHRYRLGLTFKARNDKGDRKRAADCFREVLQGNPENAQAMIALGDLYQEGSSDNPLTRSETIEMLRKALRYGNDLDDAKKNGVRARIAELEKGK